MSSSPVVFLSSTSPPPRTEPPIRIPSRSRTPASSTFIDLTESSPPPLAAPAAMPPKRRRSTSVASAGEGPSTKRHRRPAPRPPVVQDDVPVIDLDDDDPVQALLERQRAEQISAQKDSQAPATFATFTCCVCMDRPKDLTATACGHLFCHQCLVTALDMGETQSVARGDGRKSLCPMCRKKISKKKATDVIPLLLRKRPMAVGTARS